MSELSPVALYIHWPWCKAKCPYCDFNSHEGAIQEAPYIEGLLQEIEGWHRGRTLASLPIAPFTPDTHRISSVFFGGGTPSLMGAENLAKVLSAARKLGVFDSSTEVTVECNPTSFDDDKPAEAFFENLKAAGVNRVSIGIQGLKAEWLTFLGRTHKVEEALSTLDAALSVFGNVNADVIYGLPGQELHEWVELLETLAQRGLSHISAYQLTIEQNTRFFKDVRRGLWEPISADMEADFFDVTRSTLQGHGYENYEISNFAKPGFACRHNEHVWKYGEYLGLGAGAHGRVTSTSGTTIATQVVRQPEGYLRRMNDLGDGVSSAIPLNASEAAQEAVFSGLRLATGVDMEMIKKRFGSASCKEAFWDSEIAFLVSSGFLHETPRIPTHTSSKLSSDKPSTALLNTHSEPHTVYLSLTEQGWPRLNSVLERILKALPSQSPSSAKPLSTLSSAYTNSISVVIE